MAFVHGKTAKVYCDQYDLSAYFAQANVRNNVETGETTTYGVTGAAKTYLVGS